MMTINDVILRRKSWMKCSGTVDATNVVQAWIQISAGLQFVVKFYKFDAWPTGLILDQLANSQNLSTRETALCKRGGAWRGCVRKPTKMCDKTKVSVASSATMN